MQYYRNGRYWANIKKMITATSEKSYRRGFSHGFKRLMQQDQTLEDITKWYQNAENEGFRISVDPLSGRQLYKEKTYLIDTQTEQLDRLSESAYRRGYLSGARAESIKAFSFGQVVSWRLRGAYSHYATCEDVGTRKKIPADQVLEKAFQLEGMESLRQLYYKEDK